MVVVFFDTMEKNILIIPHTMPRKFSGKRETEQEPSILTLGFQVPPVYPAMSGIHVTKKKFSTRPTLSVELTLLNLQCLEFI